MSTTVVWADSRRECVNPHRCRCVRRVQSAKRTTKYSVLICGEDGDTYHGNKRRVYIYIYIIVYRLKPSLFNHGIADQIEYNIVISKRSTTAVPMLLFPKIMNTPAEIVSYEMYDFWLH